MDHRLAGCAALAVDTTALVAGCAAPAPRARETTTPDALLLQQLADSADVRRNLLGRTNPDGLVLCGLHRVGEHADADERRDLYVWLDCRVYQGAKATSGGADAAIVTIAGSELKSVRFPKHGEDLADMFPPRVANRLRQRPLEVVPDDGARREMAAERDEPEGWWPAYLSELL